MKIKHSYHTYVEYQRKFFFSALASYGNKKGVNDWNFVNQSTNEKKAQISYLNSDHFKARKEILQHAKFAKENLTATGIRPLTASRRIFESLAGQGMLKPDKTFYSITAKGLIALKQIERRGW